MPAVLRHLLACLPLLVLPCHGEDRTLPSYEAPSGLAGNLSSSGSDTLASLMALWAGAFSAYHPGVTIEVQASGSATAPPALVEGTASIGPMSRLMKGSEIAAFQRRHGYPPTAVPVALDALAVFVHQDNPLRSLDLEAVDAVFSVSRRCGASEQLSAWGDLGLRGAWLRRSLVAYGRNSASGTYGFFRDRALCGGDFLPVVNEMPGSASVVQAVGASLGAIGYSSLGYLSAGVRPLDLSVAGGPAVAPSPQSAADGSYPLARFLYAYINRAPGEALPPLEREFFRFIYSRQGQRLTTQGGYVPLPASIIAEQRKALAL